MPAEYEALSFERSRCVKKIAASQKCVRKIATRKLVASVKEQLKAPEGGLCHELHGLTRILKVVKIRVAKHRKRSDFKTDSFIEHMFKLFQFYVY